MFLIFREVPSRENGQVQPTFVVPVCAWRVHSSPDCVYIKVVRTSHGLVNMWNGHTAVENILALWKVLPFSAALPVSSCHSEFLYIFFLCMWNKVKKISINPPPMHSFSCAISAYGGTQGDKARHHINSCLEWAVSLPLLLVTGSWDQLKCLLNLLPT